jgi:hypothetical protein
MPVKWDDLLLAYEYVSFDGHNGEHQAWLCRSSGRIYWGSDSSDDSFDEEDGFGEEDEEDESSDHHETACETASDDPGKLPADIHNEDKYLPIPGKRELDLGTPLVYEFTREFLPRDHDEVRRIFSRRGAYSQFKRLLARRKAVDRWHDFENRATEEALREWCEVNSIEIEEPAQKPKPRKG